MESVPSERVGYPDYFTLQLLSWVPLRAPTGVFQFPGLKKPPPVRPTPNSFSVPGHQCLPSGHFSHLPIHQGAWPSGKHKVGSLSDGPTSGLSPLSPLLLSLSSEGSRSIEH